MTRLLTVVGLACFLGILVRTAALTCEDDWGLIELTLSLAGLATITAALYRAVPADVFGRLFVVPVLGIVALFAVWGAAAIVAFANCPPD